MKKIDCSENLLIRCGAELLELIRKAQLKVEQFNRSQFCREQLEKACNNILKGNQGRN